TSDSGIVHSSSYQYRDGLIHASSRSSPMSLTEVLVHEASHQYFYLLSRLGQVDDGTDKNSYFSPFAVAERSLDRILLAYHACGNILLLCGFCQESSAPDAGYSAQRHRVLISHFTQLAAPLRNNAALTGVGLSLYEPLAARLSLYAEQ